MKKLFTIIRSALVICVFAVSSFSIGLVNPMESVSETAKRSVQIKSVQYDSPQAAVKAFMPAWRRKNRAAMLKIAEDNVVDNIGNLIKGSTFQGCTVNTESAQKAYNCKVQAGKDDLTAVYLEVVLTRIGYRIMAVNFAAAQ